MSDRFASGWKLVHRFGETPAARPNRAQWDALAKSDAECIAVVGGKGSGKTHIGAEWMWDRAVIHAPGKAALAVGLDMPLMLMPQSLIPALRLAMKRTSWVSPNGVEYPWREGVDWSERKSSPREIAVHETGSTITMVGSGETQQRAATVENAWWDEAGLWDEAGFTSAFGRLRGGSSQHLLITTTPEKTRPHFIKWVRKNFIDSPQIGYHLIRASTRDATWLNKRYIERLRMVYTEEAQRAYIDGELLLSTGGGVYSAWTDRCVWRPGDSRPEPMPRGPEPLRICVDWGGPNFAVVIAQVWTWPTNDVGALRVVFAEFDLGPNAGARKYGEAVGAAIKANGWDKGRAVIITGDPNGGETNLGVTVTRLSEFRAGLAEKGITAPWKPIRRSPLVGDRIEAENNALEKERVMVHHRCERLIRDRAEVKWNRSGTELDKGHDGTLTHYSDADDYDTLTLWGAPDRGSLRSVVYNERELWPHERDAAEPSLRERMGR